MNSNNDFSEKDWLRCKNDFVYFAKKLQISTPFGKSSFIMEDYLHRMVCDFNNYQTNIVKKFRQGKFSTTVVCYAIWRTLFNKGHNAVFITKTDGESIYLAQMTKKIIENLSEIIGKNLVFLFNDHIIITKGDGKLEFRSESEVDRLIGKIDTIVFDEAAFHQNLRKTYNSLALLVDNKEGKIIVVSTIHHPSDYFTQLYDSAASSLDGIMSAFNAHYSECYFFQYPEKIENLKSNLGPKGFAQEVECKFK